MNLNQNDFEDLIIFALRYTFGRMTYSNSTVINIIRKHKIGNQTKDILIRDIESALEDHKRGIKIGMDSDKVIYEEFLDYLKGDSGGKNHSKLVVGKLKKKPPLSISKK